MFLIVSNDRGINDRGITASGLYSLRVVRSKKDNYSRHSFSSTRDPFPPS